VCPSYIQDARFPNVKRVRIRLDDHRPAAEITAECAASPKSPKSSSSVAVGTTSKIHSPLGPGWIQHSLPCTQTQLKLLQVTTLCRPDTGPTCITSTLNMTLPPVLRTLSPGGKKIDWGSGHGATTTLHVGL
jgi:hypothetical protein